MIGIGDKMKKIGGRNFWIILIISITTLIILTVGVIFLTRKSEKEFYSAGYIISSTASKSNKYYFNDNTVYKENVFDEYVFKDVDNKEVNTGKDNFIHYLDNSISFMKNGVILDLDNLNTSLVPYYNITDKSIIKYNNGSYYIENSDKTLILSNFLGRITDNKYIVTGSDISVRLAGNENPVRGEYFEILFIEDGIVKIENQEGSYQTITDGSVIYVGENIKIDLGTKKVSLNDEERLSLSEMTIDGNENIDIEPDDGKIENDKDNDKETNNDNKNDTGINDGNQNIAGGGENTSVIKKEVSVDLITASVGINDLSASFQVIDTDNFIKGDLILTLTNTDTGNRVYTKTLTKVSDLQNINVSSLSPGSNYLMEISEENNGVLTQYFRKVLKTQALDIKLIRDLVTSDSLSYKVDFGLSDVKSLNISLLDKAGGEPLTTYTVINGEENGVTFEGLENNTVYYIEVDSIIFNNTNYASTYTINTSDSTLKIKPILGDIFVDSDAENQKFTLKMNAPTDEDKAITRYTYEIYKAVDLTEENISKALPVYTYSQEELKDVTLGLGDKLVEKEDYRFKVIVEYYDNYKYNEIETGFSDYFQVVGKPKIIFTEELIDFNQIKGIITIEDMGCLIPFEGRECNNNVNDITIRYKSGNSTTSTSIKGKFIKDIDDINSYSMNLELNNLIQNTTYIFEVYSNIDMKNGNGMQENQYIGRFDVTTKGIESLKMQNWESNDSTYETPISVNTEMVSTVPESDYGNKLASLTFKLYRGDGINGLVGEPLKVFKDTDNIKSKYYNTEFTITSNMFGINNLDELRELSGGKLSRYYTVEVTDAYDVSETNKFDIMDSMYVFEIPSILLIEDEVEKPTIDVTPLTNLMMKSGNYDKKYDNSLGDNVIVGYEVITSFKKSKIETYFSGENPIKTINFYVNSNGINLSLPDDGIINLDESIGNTDEGGNYTYTKYFYLDYGTEYDVIDADLRRGNTHTFSYDISIDTNNDGNVDTNFPSSRPNKKMTSEKDEPIFKMYIDNSTDNSITYKYIILDEDNALYKDYEDDKYYLYYTIDGSEEEYRSEIVKSDEYNEVTLSGLSNSSIYNISYNRASIKSSDANKILLGNYLFDGVYDASNYNLGYRLDFGNFDNRLKVILDDNDFLNRVSAYLLTLDAGDDKYQTVISSLSDCEGEKCIIIDYADIEKLKKKDVKVYLEAFYDTGYIGFSQASRLSEFFEKNGVVASSNSSKIGYLFQNTNTTEMGKYVFLNEKGAVISDSSPKGILAFDFDTEKWKLNINSLLNIKNNKFVSYGEISNNISVNVALNGVIDRSTSTIKNSYNPKVLDKINIQTDDNNFIFTSIIPKVTTLSNSIINGAIIDIDLSIEKFKLESDFIKDKDGKYNFYIDIYSKCTESEENCINGLLKIKSIKTDYDNLIDVSVTGLDPDTTYYYKISADMNDNSNTPTNLFDYNRSGYVEYINSFKTLGKKEIFSRVTYDYNSYISEVSYSTRKLNINSELNTNINFDVKYELYDKNNNLKYEYTVPNTDIIKGSSNYNAKYIQDITGNDFVFGENYYTLVITAITDTDSGNNELELYNASMKNGGLGESKDINELNKPIFSVYSDAVIKDNLTNYGIESTITLTDEDKVIKDGIYYIELRDEDSNNACVNKKDCIVEVNVKEGKCNLTGNNNSCSIPAQSTSNHIVNLSFDNLKPGTWYKIYVYTDIYRNNISLANKEEEVSFVNDQYTKTDLGFTLGFVAATNTKDDEVIVKFIGSSGIEKKLSRLEYNIDKLGTSGEKIDDGTINISSDDTVFTHDVNGDPMLTIPITSGKKLGTSNSIKITYYYIDDNGTEKVLIIDGKTNTPYPIVKE